MNIFYHSSIIEFRHRGYEWMQRLPAFSCIRHPLNGLNSVNFPALDPTLVE